MRKIIIVFLLVPIISFSLELKNTYKVMFGMFGTVGLANTYLKKDSKDYKIIIDVKTQGIANFLSNNTKEIYESFGSVKDGLLLPLEYKKTKVTNSYKKIKRYTFDHENKKVILYKDYTYYQNLNNQIKGLDIEFVNKNEKSKEEFHFYAQNDILSLYFNLIDKIKLKNKNHFAFKAVGAKEKDGLIEVIKPVGKELELIKEFMNLKNDNFLKVKINQNIFTSSNGEMLINIDDKNICNKAILKDVLLFGDITAVKQK